jgi:hypothetical protein
VRTRPASLELAVLAFEYEPVRPGATHAAVPKQQCRFGLDNLEGVVTITRNCHYEVWVKRFRSRAEGAELGRLGETARVTFSARL